MTIFPFLLGRKEVEEALDKGPAFHGDQRSASIAQASTLTTLADLRALTGNYDGYVRQAAVVRCVQLARADLLPVIASRLNDWVPAIRNVARKGMESLVPLLPADAVLNVLPAVAHLRLAKRDDHGQWVDAFERAVATHVPAATLTQAVLHAPIPVARACFHLLARCELIEKSTLISTALARTDDIATARSALYMAAKLPPEHRQATYRHALISHFGAIRTIAIRALLQDDATAGKHALARAALFDIQPTARDAAIYFLRQSGANPADAYRDLLRHQPQRELGAIALVSLGSCGNKDDLALIEAMTRSPWSSLRAAALSAWLRLDPAAKDDIALRALDDGSPRTRRLAILMVNRHGAYIPRERILCALQRTHDFRLLEILSTDSVWGLLCTMVSLKIRLGDDYVFPAQVLEQLTELASRHRYVGPGADHLALLRSDAARPFLKQVLPTHAPHDRELMSLLDRQDAPVR